jgi:hypothetical protein
MGGRREAEGARGWRGSLFLLGVGGGFVLVVSCAFLGLPCSALFRALFSSVPASPISSSPLFLNSSPPSSHLSYLFSLLSPLALPLFYPFLPVSPPPLLPSVPLPFRSFSPPPPFPHPSLSPHPLY